MTQAICRYVGQDAGIVKADQLSDAQSAYTFKPYPSKAHEQLELKLKSEGHAKVEIEWQGRRIYMTATAMEPQSITLQKVP